MNKHYFYSLSKEQLEKKKQEYLNTNILLFAKKYKISTSTLVFLFGKKGMKGTVGRRIKVKIIKNKNYVKTENKLSCEFFNKGLYKKNIDSYYTKFFNKNQ